VLCALLVVGAVVLGAIALARSDENAAAADATSVPTPLWSPRRLPGPFVDPLNAEHERAAAFLYQAALDQQVARFGNACFVVERGSSVLAAHNADMPLCRRARRSCSPRPPHSPRSGPTSGSRPVSRRRVKDRRSIASGSWVRVIR
jgi:hypothetical protein